MMNDECRTKDKTCVPGASGSYSSFRISHSSLIFQPVADLDVLGLELDAGSLRLQQQQLREVLVVAVADQRLHEVARDRGRRHRHAELPARAQAQVYVLSQ